MKKHLLSHAAALCLLAPAAAMLSAPAVAAERSAAAAATPETRGLEVNADSGLAPGSQLRLTLEGSPGGQATARIPGPNIVVPLQEISPGLYSGRYTVRRTDRIDPAAVIRVTLSSANRTSAASYSFPPSFMTAATPRSQPRLVPPVPVIVQVAPAVTRIERFAVAPVGPAEPGAELRFRINGTPGARVWLDIPGVVARVPMHETRPGHYEGSYTVRSQDNLAIAGPVTATLRTDDNQVVTSSLSQPLISDSRPPQIGNLIPRQGEAVNAGPTVVGGSFDDASGSGVNPQSVRIVVSGRDVTSLAQITPREFSLRDRLPPGRHTVEVTAADRAGNVAHKSWSFEVGSSVMGAPSQSLPLMVMSHPNNAFIDQAPTTLRGRTAPGAFVRVRVDAIVPGPARRGGAVVADQLLSEAVQADSNGEFTFVFNPRTVRDNASSFPLPGTRYDVSITANRENQTAEARLMLFQRS